MAENFSVAELDLLIERIENLRSKVVELKSVVVSFESSEVRGDMQWKKTRVWKRARSEYLRFHRLARVQLRRSRKEL